MEISTDLHAPDDLPQGNGPRYPLDSGLGGPQSRPGRGSREINILPLPGIETWSSSPFSDAMLTELSRLQNANNEF